MSNAGCQDTLPRLHEEITEHEHHEPAQVGRDQAPRQRLDDRPYQRDGRGRCGDADRAGCDDIVDPDDTADRYGHARHHRAQRVLVIDEGSVGRDARGDSLGDVVVDLVVGRDRPAIGLLGETDGEAGGEEDRHASDTSRHRSTPP
jgi:hypothetical protein